MTSFLCVVTLLVLLGVVVNLVICLRKEIEQDEANS